MARKQLELGPYFFHNLRPENVDLASMAITPKDGGGLGEQIGEFYLSTTAIKGPRVTYNVSVFKGTKDSSEPQAQKTFDTIREAATAHYWAKETLGRLQNL